ncbi:MAG: hypothetical protein DI539_00250 [Flavobacterium psychrophilum]|nr:MAG: hypothetical protein DI539_00250 [Flavobacterium psychrophilum]
MAYIALGGVLKTEFGGVQRLYNFYYEASQYHNEELYIDFKNLLFLDGNLCALFQSILYRLNKHNKLVFTTDFDFIKNKFDVLIRNGFIPLPNENGDNRNSTICLKQFDVAKPDEFIEYIQNDLMSHRGLNLSEEETEKILYCFVEIFSNIELHSKTDEPFFACGQYFPENGVLKFSIVDIGNGFLPAISAKTNQEINTAYDSIIWALKEKNTTKLNAPGGLGLTDLRDYFNQNNGQMQIITGDAFWSTEFDKTTIKYQNFPKQCCGTMINLLFSYN